VHYLAATLVLGASDSGLTVQGFPGEDAWLSGAAPLANLTWAPVRVGPVAPRWVVAQGTNAVYAANPVPGGPVQVNGSYATWQACEAACQANATAGGGCGVWTWHDAAVPAPYTHLCYFRTDGVWDAVPEADHVSGRFYAPPAPNVWSASLAGTGVTAVPGLRLGGRRLIRARYPNGDPELDFFTPPRVFRANWTAQATPRSPAVDVTLAAPVSNTTPSLFQQFVAGVGGTCDRFTPSAAFWCSSHPQGGGAEIFFAPGAMQTDGATLPNTPYANASGAVVQTWRPGHWASWMYEVGATTFDAATGVTNFSFSRGGFQGSRGADAGEDTYIENIFEELDAPGEWYFNATTLTLFLWHNATSGTPPPTDGSLLATQLRHLVNVTGTQAAPVADVAFRGVGFRDTAYTYLDPHGIPSGGDCAWPPPPTSGVGCAPRGGASTARPRQRP
jgi:hypothetical protein